MRILIVDDEPNIRRTLRLTLEISGHLVFEAHNIASALGLLKDEPCEMALVDLRLGQESGLELLGRMTEGSPGLAVVVITAHASVESAVEAMRKGAFDYLTKPFTPAQVRGVLERVAREKGLRGRLQSLEDQVRAEVPEADLETTDPGVNRLLDQARTVARTEAVVLIRGENGTGKGVLARTVHSWSPRAEGPFVTVNCPSLSPELLESDLFGHARGAFTGAVKDVQGKVAAASGGTLFLDEIGDLPINLQPKLLRFLQDRKYERVGETQTRPADVRLIAATNRNLEDAVRSGSFREDLLYRINVIEFTMPPLRLRNDIPTLADRLLQFFARQTGRAFSGFTPEAMAAIRSHPWPGNLRELRNAIERAVILARGPEVEASDLPERISHAPSQPEPVGPSIPMLTLEALEAEHIRKVLAACPNLDEAAELLGIDPSTLYRKRKKLGF